MTKPSDIIPGRTVFVVGDYGQYDNWCQANRVHTIEEASFLLFCGGSDISPEIYGHRRHPSTSTAPQRDKEEVAIFKQALALGKPMLGVCRGHQLIGALSGAVLVQDQPNPYYEHPVDTHDGKVLSMTSSHHQAVSPWHLPPEDYRLLGWTVGLSSYHWGQADGEELVVGAAPGNREVEMIHWPKTRCLGIQAHPEWQWADYQRDVDARRTIDHCQDLLTRLLDGKL